MPCRWYWFALGADYFLLCFPLPRQQLRSAFTTKRHLTTASLNSALYFSIDSP